MIFNSIIAIDPSGNFNKNEKGGTGIAILTKSKKVIWRTIWAKDFTSKVDYYNQCLKPLKMAKKDTLVVIEDFRLQSGKAGVQSNSQMQTSELIGRMEALLDEMGVKHTRQQNSVKSRWNISLLKKEFFEEFGVSIYKASRHEIDALRHLLSAYFFTQHKNIF